MRKRPPFILAIIGLILGAVTALIWLFVGTFFLSAFIAGIMEAITETEVSFGASNFTPALIIILFQSVLSIVLLIVALLKTLPSREMATLKKDGLWVLILGIVILVTNPSQVLTSVLIIIAGALLLKEANQETTRVIIEKENESIQ